MQDYHWHFVLAAWGFAAALIGGVAIKTVLGWRRAKYTENSHREIRHDS